MVEEKNCFVCDSPTSAEIGVNLQSGETQHTNKPLPLILSQLVGKEFVVFVSEEDWLCNSCLLVINHVDRLEKQLEAARRLIIGHLRLKYNISEENCEDDLINSSDLANDSVNKDSTSETDSDGKQRRQIKFERDLKKFTPAALNSTTANNLANFHQSRNPEECWTTTKTNWECNVCQLRVKNISDYRLHMKSHNLLSSSDSKLAEPKQNLISMEDSVDRFQFRGVNKFDDCKNGIFNPCSDEVNSESSNFQCHMCSVLFLSKESLFSHVKSGCVDVNQNNNNNQAGFVDCNNFQSVETVSSPEESKTYRCSSCSLKFNSAASFVGHVCVGKTDDIKLNNNRQLSKDCKLGVIKVNAINSTGFDSSSKGHQNLDTSDSKMDSDGEQTDDLVDNDEQTDAISNAENFGDEVQTDFAVNNRPNFNDEVQTHFAMNNEMYSDGDQTDDLVQNTVQTHAISNADNFNNLAQADWALNNRPNFDEEFRIYFAVNNRPPPEKFSFICDCLFLTDSPQAFHEHSMHCDTFFCYVCEMYVKRSIKFDHMQKVHLVYMCRMCSFKTATKRDLKMHELATHCQPVNVPRCQYCGERFTNKRKLLKHENDHPESFKYGCGECGERFRKELHLEKHREKHRELVCVHCGKHMVSLRSLKLHESRHTTEGHVCATCGRVFKTKSAINNHMAEHTGNYKYKCDICQQGFMSKMMFEEHKAKHTKEERYMCDVCGLKFQFQSTMWVHRKWHTNPFPYKCSECDRLFKHSSLLAVHRRKHTGERPYQCHLCQAKFAVSGTLKRHLMLHTHKSPYLCDLCPPPSQTFTALHKLSAHIGKVHNRRGKMAAVHRNKNCVASVEKGTFAMAVDGNNNGGKNLVKSAKKGTCKMAVEKSRLEREEHKLGIGDCDRTVKKRSCYDMGNDLDDEEGGEVDEDDDKNPDKDDEQGRDKLKVQNKAVSKKRIDCPMTLEDNRDEDVEEGEKDNTVEEEKEKREVLNDVLFAMGLDMHRSLGDVLITPPSDDQQQQFDEIIMDLPLQTISVVESVNMIPGMRP